MEKNPIANLAYRLKQAQKNSQPAPIFFLGAGASKSAGIPLAEEIATHILNTYPNNPRIQNLGEEKHTYAQLMNCLSPYERNTLLKDYIDEAKINVTHIYLAQMLKEGFVDYVLTVNFDNLMLRALALYNIFPPTYDMAIFKDFTTTSFREKAVVYLHGQHHGAWLLNTPEEMEKVKKTVPRIFDTIKNQRPWIFIGYSGSDPIFEHIKNLGRFDNGLYWVGHEDYLEPEVKNFLNTANTNAFYIKGYNADAFMLKLNHELGLPQPDILAKPFSALQHTLSNITDIDDDDRYTGVKERLEITREQVAEAISLFEDGQGITVSDQKRRVDTLKQELITTIINENYKEEHIANLEAKVNKINHLELNHLLAELYFSWGVSLVNMAAMKSGKEVEFFYEQAIEKFQRATEIKPIYEAFYNWGTALMQLASTKPEKYAETFYEQAIEKFQRATEIKPIYDAFNTWGNALYHLAQIKSGKEQEELYEQAIEKFQRATEIKPTYDAFNTWGSALYHLAQIKSGQEQENLYKQAIDQYQQATQIKPDYHDAFNNWGVALSDLAQIKSGQEQENLYKQAFDQYQKAIELGGDHYNLACLYAIQGNKKDALHHLAISLKAGTITTQFVLEDEDWAAYHDDPDFQALIQQYG